MEMLHFQVPPLQNNAYLLYDEGTREAVVIDPAAGSAEITAAVQREGLKVTAIVNTHGHHDHTADNAPLQQAVGGKIAIHETDAYRLERNAKEARWYLPVPPPPSKAEVLLKEGSEVKIGPDVLRVLHTPGHTLGSIALHHRDSGRLWSGDTVMAGTYGRYDGPGGSFAKLVETVRALLQLPSETRVFPGHGEFTTIEAESGWMENLRYQSSH